VSCLKKVSCLYFDVLGPKQTSAELQPKKGVMLYFDVLGPKQTSAELQPEAQNEREFYSGPQRVERESEANGVTNGINRPENGLRGREKPIFRSKTASGGRK
jgi:hypothetical protein